jgi:hypothetical protein
LVLILCALMQQPKWVVVYLSSIISGAIHTQLPEVRYRYVLCICIIYKYIYTFGISVMQHAACSMCVMRLRLASCFCVLSIRPLFLFLFLFLFLPAIRTLQRATCVLCIQIYTIYIHTYHDTWHCHHMLYDICYRQDGA